MLGPVISNCVSAAITGCATAKQTLSDCLSLSFGIICFLPLPLIKLPPIGGGFTLILPPDAEYVYDDAGQFGSYADWMEPRIHAIQVVSNYSVLHFYSEIITGWSVNCVIKQLEM
jgi:hypothetical protein